MRYDEYGRGVITSDELCTLLYKNPELALAKFLVEDAEVFNQSAQAFHYDIKPLAKYEPIHGLSMEEFDQRNCSNWHMPEEYKTLDIAKWLLDRCTNEQQLQRVAQELFLYQERNLFPLLQYLKYLVDTLTKNNVVWGVGRGSSVASYILFLIGVHRIDSLKYDLDVTEFLK